MTIGITGGIGAGKSVVSRILRCNGFRVYDCDSRARYLMENDGFVKEALIRELGRNIYTESGKLNRELLGKLMFSQKDVRKYVNLMVHSAVRNDIEREREKVRGRFFIESAIMRTGEIDRFCDVVWIVEAPVAIRIKRVKERDGLSETQIEERIRTQQKEFEFPENKEVVFLNNDGISPLLKEVIGLIEG